MKRLSIIIFSILIWNCSGKNKSGQSIFKIDNRVKLEFLNEILSDTINLELLPDKNIMISDFNFISNTPRSILINGEYSEVNEVDFLSYHLKENDTAFLKDQLRSNKDFDIGKLSEFGFQVINTSELLNEGISIVDLPTVALENHVDSDISFYECFVMIDKPIFNKSLSRAYLSLNKINSGTDYVFIKENGSWLGMEIEGWVE